MNLLRWGVGLTLAASALVFSGGTQAQEDLDKGKNAAQLFASDCVFCHKSPQGLAKSGGLLGLESFLREHYTASRESAKSIANYIKSMDTGPAGSARSGKRTAKGDDKAKQGDRKKSEGKPGDKDSSSSTGPKASAAKPADSKSQDILAPEPKDAPRPRAAVEPKPDASKSEKMN